MTEKEQLEADAAVLEQAAGILERVYSATILTDATLYTVHTWLGYQAQAWCLEAERA